MCNIHLVFVCKSRAEVNVCGVPISMVYIGIPIIETIVEKFEYQHYLLNN